MTLEGQRIRQIRQMRPHEASSLGWDTAPDHQRPPVVILESGMTLIPSRDPEGNGPGALFSQDPDGTTYIVTASTDDDSED